MTEEAYKDMVVNTKKLKRKLQGGYYLKRALNYIDSMEYK